MTNAAAVWYNKNINNMPVEKLFTISEVAKKLKVSERSVRRYIKARRLRAAKTGQWRVTAKDLERFFNTNANRRH